ncbi:MAG TPA: xanthine dehydrogenase family protein subunit M [Azospirillaceae bacterium]|nr:xanthine dehydrogenase family protein subunit M [Azospirillaceae bacterium]
MHPFAYLASGSVPDAVAHAARRPHAVFIAGGTDLLQLLQERVEAPSEVIDINRLPLQGIETDGEALRIRALVTLADAAAHPAIRDRFPAIAEALEETASPQVRNMATVAGNLLQRTRCLYFRDNTTPCNKRTPGAGCSAMDGVNRMNAVLGVSDHCIAAHPSDLAVALLALDARLRLHGPDGSRDMAVADLHREPGDRPDLETNLRRGELITEIVVPSGGLARRSCYVKVRDRAAFEWALVSAAAAIEVEDGVIRRAGIAAGGVGTKPWRLEGVAAELVGKPPTPETLRTAAERAGEGARPRPGNAFKVELLKRTVARALMTAGVRA